MHLALEEAKTAGDEVPVGAVLVGPDGSILSSGHNLREATSDPTSHAEIEVIRAATASQGDWRLEGATLFVTLEPCIMCAGAILASRVSRVVFGAWDEKLGGSGSLYDLLRDPRFGRPVEVVSGVLEVECTAVLKEFFASRRA